MLLMCVLLMSSSNCVCVQYSTSLFCVSQSTNPFLFAYSDLREANILSIKPELVNCFSDDPIYSVTNLKQ